MIVEPASIADVPEFFAPRLTVPARLYRHLITQMAGGPAWTARAKPGGPPLAIGGVYRFGDRPSQAWLLSRPGLGRHLLGIVGRARAALAAERDQHPAIIAYARTHEGARLAAVLGFVPDGETVWRLA